MKILIIGGTRFLGMELLKQLTNRGHDVVVVSRRANQDTVKYTPVKAERSEGLKRIKEKSFDVTFDFIAYDDNAVAEVFNSIKTDKYIFISSIWISRLGKGIAANNPVEEIDFRAKDNMAEITWNYLIGKQKAESLVLERRKRDEKSTVLRLPILWGVNDPTGRLEFYCQRISDGRPVIIVNGGRNFAQISWVNDVAHAMLVWIEKDLSPKMPIWEGLQGKGEEVRDILDCISEVRGCNPKMVAISSDKLRDELPEYLEAEPLWREKNIDITGSNLFRFTGINPKKTFEWLEEVVDMKEPNGITELRLKEICFLREIN